MRLEFWRFYRKAGLGVADVVVEINDVKPDAGISEEAVK